MEEISQKVSSIDLEGCDISMGEALEMIEFIQNQLNILRTKLLECNFESEQEEICFFKEMKPQILSQLLYFNKIYTIELKQPHLILSKTVTKSLRVTAPLPTPTRLLRPDRTLIVSIT